MPAHENMSSLETFVNAMKDTSLMKGFYEQTRLSLAGLLTNPKDCFDHGNNASTILLVHGLGCTNNVMTELGEVLKERYNVAYAPNSGYGHTGDMYRSALKVGGKIKQALSEQEKNGDLHVFTHSLGGLIALQALLQDPSLHVHSVSTCSTSFRGAPIGKLAFFSKAARQMNRIGGFIPEGTNLDDALEKLYVHIATNDTWIPPSSHLPYEGLSSNIILRKHEEFTHTSFIVGDKVEKFAASIDL